LKILQVNYLHSTPAAGKALGYQEAMAMVGRGFTAEQATVLFLKHIAI